MPLTDTAIRTLKPAAKSYRKSDERGLYLEIYPKGAKLWRFKYRFLDKEKRVALGAYPDVSLAQARKKRDAFREQLAQGIDPSMERKRERLVAKISAANTFKEVAEEYIDTKLRKEGKAQVTIDKAHWLVSQFAAISDLPVSEIKPIEVLAVLKRLVRCKEARDGETLPFLCQPCVPLRGCYLPRRNRPRRFAYRGANRAQGETPCGVDRSS